MNLDWQIGPFEAFTSLSGKEDVIHVIHWRANAYETVNGDDGSSSTYHATIYGSAQFDIETLKLDSFTPHDQLTKNQVVGWLVDGKLVDMNMINHSLSSQIEAQKKPVKKSLVPSWVNIPMAPSETPPSPTTTLT
jgi:hypothetical protein